MNAKLAKAVRDLDRITKMVDSGLVAKYKKNRAENPGLPASYALRWARDVEASNRPEDFNVRGNPFTVDGFDIEITYDYDDANDYSHLGEFTDSWDEDAVRNPEAWTSHGNRNHSYLAYFVPAITEREHFDGLHKMGMSKSVAHEVARSYVLRDMDQARDFTSYVIEVTASKEGVVLGRDYLGGVEDEDYIPSCVIDHDMIGNAISEAKSTLAKLQED